MPMINEPYTLLLTFSAVISGILAVIALKQKPSPGTHSFATLMGAVALWALVSAFEVGSPDPNTKTFSYSLKYVFVVIVPVTWFSFGLYYSNRIRHLRTLHIGYLMALPMATLIIIITNAHHQWIFTTLEWYHTDSNFLVVRKFGFWFWIHTSYCYALLALGTFFLAKSTVDSPGPYRKQLAALLGGCLTPWLANMIFIFDFNWMPGLDLTPFAFTVSGLAFMLGILRYRVLDIVPIAHDIVIKSMNNGILVLDTDGRILNLNASAAQLACLQISEAIGMPIREAVSWWPGTSASCLDETPLTRTVDVTCKEQTRLIQLTRSVIRAKDKPVGHLIVMQDTTHDKLAEKALRNSEERFRSLAENAPVIIFTLDENRRLTYVNPAWNRILGRDHRAVVGTPIGDYLVKQELHADPLEPLMEGSAVKTESNLVFRDQNGDQRLFDASLAVNSDIEGRITGIIGMARDITQECKLQEQLIQSQKMEAIGTLAGGIAHDFNNLLMGMQANISLLRLELNKRSPLTAKLDRIEDQIQIGASLTRQLLGYARKGKYQVNTINLSRLIEDTLHVVQRTNKSISVHCRPPHEPLHLDADRGQIELVLLNIFVNAMDAMPNGGELTVETRQVDHTSAAASWPDLKEGQYVELRVSDTGVGMDQATMDRIFEPFFTTKEMGQGTGLGLASVYGVVKNHGGYIRVDSQPGRGATFTFLFPASDNILIESPADAEAGRIATGGKKILLVDDEAPILMFCAEMIETLGYEVLTASNGQDAVKTFSRMHDEIELVLLDMVMPVMNGAEVFEQLKSIDPQLKVIIASGYGANAHTEKILAQGSHAILKKPYTRDDLVQTIARLTNSAYIP